MDKPRGSLIPRDVETLKELRVTPLELKFQDTLAGRVYRQPITVHNLGRSNQKIRFMDPVKPQFKLIMNSLDRELAPGLQMTAMVEYHPNKNENTFDQLYIAIGNEVIEIPLIGLIPCCQLEIEPEVNFGTLIANSKVYCKEISIINHGKAPGMFTTEYQGQLPIVIFPTNGVVKPRSSTIVKVDFCADEPRVVNEVAKVTLQGRPDVLLNIKVRVVEQIIELLNMDEDKKVECIRFGPVYFGASKLEHVLLHNKSPAHMNWVAIMQNDSVGEELGTNIPLRTDVVMNNLTFLRKIKDIDVSTFISCVPNEGRLLPYQKTKLTFCFSPKLITDGKNETDPLHRQDYAIFLRIDSVGSKDGFLRDDDSKTLKNDQFQKLELAVTGSGIPVVLQFDSGNVFHFPPCSIDERSDISFVMENRSKLLPVYYHFKKIANFRIDPERGKLGEGCMQKVTCSFFPHQYGAFKTKQFLEFIGPVADETFQSLSMKPFHRIHLLFNSVCKTSPKQVMMNISPGQLEVKDLAKYKEYAPVAVLQSAMTTIHNHRSTQESVKDALIAFPNDRAASVRPGERDKHFSTIFTKIPRYNYVDTEFAYTNSEMLEKKAHDDQYRRYIDGLKTVRLQKIADREDVHLYYDTDIGLEPSSGLKSPLLSIAELDENLSSAECELKPYQLLCTRNIESKEAKALGRKILTELKSCPSTTQEKRDCSLMLTPKQIHQVIVGPSVLNFGDVCINSINTHRLHIVNMLSKHVLLQLDINLKELQKTKQLSYVIPPAASTYISVIFHSLTAGKFWKSFTFTLNNIPGGHLLVMAVVTPVRLQISSDELVLKQHGFFLKTCFMETVRLYNRQNYFVHFEWLPVCTAGGIFSISPTKGTVEPFSLLDCEVTWQSGFSSSAEAEFVLRIEEGDTVKLKCVVNFGKTKVLFMEQEMCFKNIPQGLATSKKVILHNVGQNHAYFKVRKQSLLPFINFVPSEGIIPFGALTVLNILCAPTMIERFETRAKVAFYHANDAELKIRGIAAVSDVEIQPNEFLFNGTYVGTTQIIPFLVINKGITRVRVEFNLENRQYFSMDFKDKSGNFTDPAFPDVYFVELEGETSTECGITFSPQKVVTYEFDIQVRINSVESSKLYTEYHSLKSSEIPSAIPLIQPCFVQATVLQSPLKLSSTKFIFDIPSYIVTPKEKIIKTQELVLYNSSESNVEWTLDISKTGKLFKDGVFQFSVLNGVLHAHEQYKISIMFCPGHSRKSTANVPICLNTIPVSYQTIQLVGEVRSPKILFDPPYIFFTPVPLNVTSVMNITILPQSYYRNAKLHVSIRPARILGGDEEIQPLSVNFLNGTTITGSPKGINTELICHFSFKSSKPVSFSTSVLFYDNIGNRFSLPVAATAENCILTVYPYMADHLDKEEIILRNDRDPSPVETADNVSPPSDKVAISFFASTKSDSDEPAKRLYVGIEPTPEKLTVGESEKSKRDSIDSVEMEEENKHFSPEPGTKAHDFFQKVVNAVETWFTLFGWPQGPHSLSIPETIRRDVCKMQLLPTMSLEKHSVKPNDVLRFTRTIYDVILHLCGQMPDGIHSAQYLPVDSTERVIQLYMQYSSVLDFLSVQGASLPHILPEFLFDPEDYKKWLEVRSSSNAVPARSSMPKKWRSVVIDMTEFETWSKQSWTDLFLQMYKVFVLSRVQPHSKNDLPHIYIENSPKINPCFVSSNIYSNSERILLSWMNTNYETTRHAIWGNCQKDVIPAERWIVNFDEDLSDGLVFATLLGAYCPFLIEPHFVHMYTQPKSPEQYFHNCLIIVKSFRDINFSMGIQASDICEPNPILMLMLCAHMYQKLPEYLPKESVTFRCILHDTVMRQILVSNPHPKKLVYTATIIGRDAADFSLLPDEDIVTIPAKKESTVNLKFTSRFLHMAEASLLLVCEQKNGVEGTTLMFTLKGEVYKFKPIRVVKCKTPCYKWTDVTVKVENPFHKAGDFNVILVESSTFVSSTSQITTSRQFISSRTEDKAPSNDEHDTDEDEFHAPKTFKTSIRSTTMREFFCSSPVVHLGVKTTSVLKLCFVPFDMKARYCIIILSNKKIGEVVYVVEGNVMVPLPSKLPGMASSIPETPDFQNPQEVSTEEESPVLYLKGKPKEKLNIELILPLTNEAKEEALAFAAQKQMSDLEYQRRLLTGTLHSSSIRVAVAVLGLTRVETFKLFNISELRKPKSISYATQVSLPLIFTVPKEIHIPQYPKILTKELKPSNSKVPEGSFPVPLQFYPYFPGYFPCKILLTSKYDVRLYYVEGVVSDGLPAARYSFETPAFKPLTRKIPLINAANKPMNARVTIDGECFVGPTNIFIKPGETLHYPLTFKPVMECEFMGKLTVHDKRDGMDHIVAIKGIGRKPVALEHIVANCHMGVPEERTIIVPNHTKDSKIFKASSNLPIVWGKKYITIYPGDVAPYTFHIMSLKSGVFKGKLSFSTKNDEDDDFEELSDEDEDQDEVHPENIVPIYRRSMSEQYYKLDKEYSDADVRNVRVWYDLEILIHPAKPIDTIEKKCVALERIPLEIPLKNAKEESVTIQVLLSTPALSGLEKFTLNPEECIIYTVYYTPSTTGCRDESIIFQPAKLPEFWYLLKFTVKSPKSITVPEVECDLGKDVIQMVALNNPTHETLTLQVKHSNPENFVLDTPTLSLTIPPRVVIEVPVRFRPSGLGRSDHGASIIFSCAQFKEWKFLFSGVGLFPQPLEIQRITAYLHRKNTIFIRFENPTKENVLINILLTNQEMPKNLVLGIKCDSFLIGTSAFKLDLTETQGILMPSRSIIIIPVIFDPKVVKLKQTMVVIQMMRENGENWPIDNFDELSTEMKSTMGVQTGEIHKIQWLYPILGLPEASHFEFTPVVVKCRTKTQIVKEMKVFLTGEFLGKNPILLASDFIVIPKLHSYASYEDFNDIPITREFEYELQYESDEMKSNLKASVSIYLKKKAYAIERQMIALKFNVKFSPQKPVRTQVILKIECISEGVWNFPIKLVATEPHVDGVLIVEGNALLRETVNNFCISGWKSCADPFTAYMLPSSDPVFSVKPESGEIPPLDSDGIILSVNFKPHSYGRTYKGKLVIETKDMYFSYTVNGIPQVPKPPQNVKAKIDATNKKFDKRLVIRRNFVAENIDSVKGSSTTRVPLLILRNKL